jgi:ACR3 family arsenite efflux pump ArsB
MYCINKSIAMNTIVNAIMQYLVTPFAVAWNVLLYKTAWADQTSWIKDFLTTSGVPEILGVIAAVMVIFYWAGKLHLLWIKTQIANTEKKDQKNRVLKPTENEKDSQKD